MSMTETVRCPFCGEEIDSGARSCYHCGSDNETGWAPDVEHYSPELDFDYEETLEQEFGVKGSGGGGGARGKKRMISPVYAVTGGILLGLFAFFWIISII